MNLSIGKKIALGFAVALAALLIVGLSSYLNLGELNTDSGWVTHTVIVEQKLENLLAGILQMESSARGYNLSPDPRFKALAQDARVEITADFRTLRTLTLDNTVQQVRLDKLQPLLDTRIAMLQQLIAMRDVSNEDPTQRLALVNEGQSDMGTIRQIITDMVGEEERLLKIRQNRAATMSAYTFATLVGGTILSFLAVGIGGFLVTRSITSPIQILGQGAEQLGTGNYAYRVNVSSKDEVGRLAAIFNHMAAQVEARQRTQEDQDWLKTSLAHFTNLFQGRRNPSFVCHSILAELARLLHAPHSVLYVPDRTSSTGLLKLQGSYAAEGAPEQIAPGDGLIGQCFLSKERIILHDLPADYFRIGSALGETRPKIVVVQPALFEGEVKAVLELASLQEFTPLQLTFLEQLSESVGIVLHTIEGDLRTEELLRQSQELSETLRHQQSELSVKNVELETQAERLRASELLLKEQQEELKQTNEELEQTNEELQQTNSEIEEKVILIGAQKQETERINGEMKIARKQLEEKAEQVALASKYKSDFLASMSHELRTPLNSLLILSKILSDNPEKNLDEKQVKYAKTIYSSGNDLLELINEILDLSKIESGSVEMEPDQASVAEIRDFAEQNFRHVAESRHLEFSVEMAPDLPTTIETDARRLEQVLKNLLANAFKFTKQGSVRLSLRRAAGGWGRDALQLSQAGDVLAFSVTDTGIGIPPEKQQLIFEAFQQADAGTARKYGGTGLGLSISRELAALLGGSLQVKSTPGEGSTFTLYLPVVFSKQRPAPSSAGTPPPTTPFLPEKNEPMPTVLDEEPSSDSEGMDDDRAALIPGEPLLLIIEDDRNFAHIMMDFAREKKFKVIVARNAAQGVAWARRANPSAITLDLHLPDNDGWIVLDQLKHDPKTRHIPIHIISVDSERDRSLRLGAVSYVQKPVTKEALEGALNQTIEFINRPLKNLLIIEDDAVQRQSLVDLIGNGDVKSTAAGTAVDAFRAMDQTHFDCVVIDLGLPDKNGIELIREIHQRYGASAPPIIVYTGQELSRQEETELRMIAESIVIKNVRSPERLLDETALFLHRVQAKLPESTRRMIEQGQKNESVLSGRKVLVVDDDVRNIFAITSALETSQMRVVYAESGQAGIDLLQKDSEIEAVLMDVMMPEMDGFEAIRRIRALDKFKKLPIISVTAKAMKGDREKCLEAGASDYITKPLDMDQLRSLLRVWLYR